jgi:hypothetical protein
MTLRGEKWAGILLVSACLAAGIGCAAYHPRPVSPEERASVFEARTLDNTDFKAFLGKNLYHGMTPWPPPSWDFTALTLAAFYFLPDFDVARAKWKVAEAAIIPLPSGAGQRAGRSRDPWPLSSWAGLSVRPFSISWFYPRLRSNTDGLVAGATGNE